MADESAGAAEAAPALRGRWERADPGPDDLFPAAIEFKEATYLASKAPGQCFIVWDAGTYAVADEPVGTEAAEPSVEASGVASRAGTVGDAVSGSLTLSTATDSLETYPVVVLPDAFEVTVEDGRTLRYERAGAAPDS